MMPPQDTESKRRALQAGLRGIREGLAICPEETREWSILDFIEGELLDLLGAQRCRRRFDRGPLDDPSPHAG